MNYHTTRVKSKLNQMQMWLDGQVEENFHNIVHVFHFL